MIHKGEDPCEKKQLLAEQKLKILGKNTDVFSWLLFHAPCFFKGMKTKKTFSISYCQRIRNVRGKGGEREKIKKGNENHWGNGRI